MKTKTDDVWMTCADMQDELGDSDVPELISELAAHLACAEECETISDFRANVKEIEHAAQRLKDAAATLRREISDEHQRADAKALRDAATKS